VLRKEYGKSKDLVNNSNMGLCCSRWETVVLATSGKKKMWWMPSVEVKDINFKTRKKKIHF